MTNKPTTIEERTYRYQSAEYGTLMGAPRQITVRLSYSFGGYAISYRYNGERRFSPWPATKGKRTHGELPRIWEALERMSQIGTRLA